MKPDQIEINGPWYDFSDGLWEEASFYVEVEDTSEDDDDSSDDELISSEEAGLHSFLLKTKPKQVKPKTKPVRPRYLSKLDWSRVQNPLKKIAVTKVENQLQMPNCWTFPAAGAVESAWMIKTGKLLELSKKQLVDCVHPGVK